MYAQAVADRQKSGSKIATPGSAVTTEGSVSRAPKWVEDGTSKAMTKVCNLFCPKKMKEVDLTIGKQVIRREVVPQYLQPDPNRLDPETAIYPLAFAECVGRCLEIIQRERPEATPKEALKAVKQ